MPLAVLVAWGLCSRAVLCLSWRRARWQDLFIDPVMCEDGHTYEQAAIERWFSHMIDRGLGPTSPLTNDPLPSTKLIPDHGKRALAASWRAR